MNKIVIIGQGNIGRRHGESLLKGINVSLELRDRRDVIEDAKLFYENLETINSSSKFEFNEIGSPFSSKQYDLAIIATDSQSRFKALSDMMTTSSARYLILEKPLTNSLDELISMKEFIGGRPNFYVNLPREMMRAYLELKNYIAENKVQFSKIYISGGRLGLASNLIHYLRLIEFLTDDQISYISKKSVLRVVESKRKGYSELIGTITAVTDSGIESEISSRDNSNQTKIILKAKTGNIAIFEKTEKIFLLNQEFHLFPLEMQSSLTLRSYIQFQNNQSSLPTFTQVYKLQLLILELFTQTDLFDRNSKRIRFS